MCIMMLPFVAVGARAMSKLCKIQELTIRPLTRPPSSKKKQTLPWGLKGRRPLKLGINTKCGHYSREVLLPSSLRHTSMKALLQTKICPKMYNGYYSVIEIERVFFFIK